jgi:hypothetical protein
MTFMMIIEMRCIRTALLIICALRDYSYEYEYMMMMMMMMLLFYVVRVCTHFDAVAASLSSPL